MNRIKLTPATIERLRAEAQKKSTTMFKWDVSLPGFGIRATSKGTVAFVAQHKSIGRRTIGLCDVLSIEQARAQAIDLLNRTPDQPLKLSEAVPLFLNNVRDGSRYRAEQADTWNNHIIRKLGPSKLAHSISKGDCMRYIDSLSKGSRYNHFQHIQAFLTWAKGRDIVAENALRDVTPPERSTPRERRLYEKEVRALWHSTDDETCPYQMAYRVALLTGLRIQSEAASLRWTDFEDRKVNGSKLTELWCHIPGARTKNKRAHSFFVTPLTKACFDAMLSRNKRLSLNSPFVFACFGGSLPISDRGKGNWSRKKKQLVERMVNHLAEPLESFWVHDFRRTAGWFLADEDVGEEVIHTIHGHTRSKISRTYQTHKLEKKCKLALLQWEARLQQIVHGV